MNRIVIATDTFDQVNGVSTTYKNILKVTNHSITIIHPGQFKWKSFKVYPEIQVCIEPFKVYRSIIRFKPTHMHIATEGPVGLIARIYCKINKIPFSSSYHTKFPEYLQAYFRFPPQISYFFLRLFHKKSKAVLVPSKSCKKELEIKNFKNLVLWTRGVNKELIIKASPSRQAKKIKVLNVGRISIEKNIDALCILQDKFDITIVGQGPYLNKIKKKYKKIKFYGYKFGKDLAKIYSENDVFCFTSKTDTFGIVMIEALCNGLPVAAYNVTGPKDIIINKTTGFLGSNLEENIKNCINLNRQTIQNISVKKWTWESCEKILFNNLLS
ncbi:MAG: glycosyltransferase [Methylophilales bacterium]|nr:glycosyltransferase [Methylophilales bacterium]